MFSRLISSSSTIRNRILYRKKSFYYRNKEIYVEKKINNILKKNRLFYRIKNSFIILLDF